MNFKEKMELSKQVAELGSDLSNTSISMSDRLRKSRQRQELLIKLKASTQKTEPSEPESYKITAKNIQKLREGTIKAGDRFVGSSGQKWHKASSAKQAASKNGITSRVRVEGKKDLGFSLVVAPVLPKGTVLSVNEGTNYDKDMDANIYFFALEAPKGVNPNDLLEIAKCYDERARLDNEYGVVLHPSDMEQMASEYDVKLDIRNLHQEAKDSFGTTGLDVFKGKEPPIDEDQPPVELTADIIARYRAGEFNSVSASQFKDVLFDVSNAGMDLEEIKDGVVDWFEHNPKQLAA
ncbi:hypothetical protein [Vibrio marisflavi]|uniref:Phage protein n=1 Tax=Vibrio marisflavi CECT 7928 TaxID=634439 RepID=A0ABM9AB67_9VIBR|nr:hypothetical protein [Vibrio marisflavi]CAH0543104.1 hypothetical protein VMF7928_04402 [Vibrio marisflavi CECT 7928]